MTIITGPRDGETDDADDMRKPLGPPLPRASTPLPVRKRAPQQQRPGFIVDADGRFATDGYPLPEAPKPKWMK